VPDLTESKSPSLAELPSLSPTDIHPLYIITQTRKYLSRTFKSGPIENGNNLYVETPKAVKLGRNVKLDRTSNLCYIANRINIYPYLYRYAEFK
jgi:hypothetical protein